MTEDPDPGTPSRGTTDRPRTDRYAGGERIADRPTRGAERNRGLAETDHARDALLPSLDTGVTLLDVEGRRGVPVVQSLVLDHLLTADGPAFWVDADGYATTTSLARIAPSRRLLDRVRVARGFTAYQHYAAVCDLAAALDRATASPPALVVAPAVDARYRDADGLDGQAERLLTRALARLRRYAEREGVPVLVTRTVADDLSAPVAATADRRLRCERTAMGPRFVGEEFETRCYPLDGGEYYQTTFAYWRQVLAARADAAGLDTAGAPAPVAPATESSGGPITPRPMLDAWAGAGGR